jgi:nucleotide-binding universal stress UspA family protein
MSDMIRDLMLPMTATAGDDNALAAAIALAGDLDAHLAVIEPVNLPMPYPNPWGLMPDAAMAGVYSTLRDQGEVNAARLRQRLERESISAEVRIVESLLPDPARSLALHARYADLSVMTASKESLADSTAIARLFSALLFESGRPVLVISPHHPMVHPLKHAVVAWQPTRDATRALHDALPLLRVASSVDVLMVDPVVGESRHGEEPGADIALHLARHGIRVNVVVHARQRETVATALQRHAAESGAQLLVAGGYGHSRLREWALGGTTRELLDTISLPILFSH